MMCFKCSLLFFMPPELWRKVIHAIGSSRYDRLKANQIASLCPKHKAYPNYPDKNYDFYCVWAAAVDEGYLKKRDITALGLSWEKVCKNRQ